MKLGHLGHLFLTYARALERIKIQVRQKYLFSHRGVGCCKKVSQLSQVGACATNKGRSFSIL